MRNFKQLEVWKEARSLNKEIYLLTESFPKTERFGLTAQIRRCSISIAANIAEGSAKESNKDFTRFLEISQGSCFELESHLLLANDIGFVENSICESHQKRITLLQRRLYKFITYNRSVV